MRALFAIALLASCGGDIERDAGDARAGSDAVPNGADATVRDGSFVPPDGFTGCNGVGRSCDLENDTCEPTETCYVGSMGGVCSTSRPICLGFAGAECPEEAPHCLVLPGTDYGLCASDEEEYCICNGPGSGAVSCQF